MKNLLVIQPIRKDNENERFIETINIIHYCVDYFLKDDVELVRYDYIFNNPLQSLSNAISVLNKAYIIYFGKGWVEDKYCHIIHDIAIKYDLKVIYYIDVDF